MSALEIRIPGRLSRLRFHRPTLWVWPGRYQVEADGWYRDPYLVHDDRWFSAG